MIFQERLNEELKAKGWKQVDLCKAAGISSSQATHLMNGRTKDPTLTTAGKIAEALDVSLDYLAGRTDNPAGMTADELVQMKIDAEARTLLRGFELLPPEGKTAIQDQVDFQLSKSKNKASSTRMASPAVEVA